MKILNAIDINALALLVIGCICLNAAKRKSRSRVQHGLYMALSLMLVILLVVDSTTKIVDGMPNGHFWSWASNTALYLFEPVVPAIWVLYVDYQVYHDRKRLKKVAAPLAFIILLNAVATAASLAMGWFFTISADNEYSRGPLYLLHAALCYMFLVYAFVFTIINRKRIDERQYATMLLFPLPATIGGILQILFYGLTLIWSGMTLSMVLIYFNIQNRRLDTDYLTGVYNRRLLDSFMKQRMQSGTAKKAFSAILIDLDHFKEINDRLGHKAGDNALTDAVGLLKSCLRQGDFVSRYGGDEFLIILDIACRETLEITVQRIRKCFEQFNENQARPYKLEFSSGYDLYDTSGRMTPSQFIKHVDALMYEDKRNI
jgi:diguanylate cyclase (GGDEF)-like protein